MLSAILVVVLFLLFSFLIYKMVRRQTIQLSWTQILLAYGFKIVCGCLYGYLFLHYYGGSDTWVLHADGIKEKEMLLKQPLQFFSEFGPATAIRKGSSLIEIAGFYLVDLEYCLQAKTLGIVNLVSNNNYYINVVFWNFFIFWGHYWLLCLLLKQFPSRKNIYFFFIFLFPPVVFWLSGIRSDGVLFFSISLMLLHFHNWLSEPKVSSLLLWVIGFVGILIFRPPFAALFVPALIAWWISSRSLRKPLTTFLLVYAVSAVIFFATILLPSGGFPEIVASRQQDFMKLQGTAFKLDTLQPEPGSFIRILPQAFTNTFFRPYPWEAKGFLQVMTAIETVLFWLIVVLTFINSDPQWKINIRRPLLLTFLFFSTSLYLFIGYTIPFPGAIVRYKAIPELLFLTAITSFINSSFSRFKLK